MSKHTCGQCEYYMNKECPFSDRTALSEGCGKFKYTNPEGRIDFLQAENEHLSNTVESTRQDYADLLDGTMEAKLQAENASLKEIADLALNIHTRDGLYVKEKWGVMGIDAEKLLVSKIEALTGE